MTTLFNQKLLKNSIEKFLFPDENKRLKIDKIIKGWQTALKDHDLAKTKETSIQGSFFAKIFCEILGYKTQDEGLEEWTLKQEAKTEVDSKEADGSLGFYSKNASQTRCVIELKDAGCNLDVKQHSRENKQTPVEQAFQYLYKFADCDWVIASNFRYTRLYHKSKGQTAYEEFDILKLDEEKEFRRFYYCLCAQNLLEKNANSPLDLLIKQSGEQDIDITKEFYNEFKKVRKLFFEHIVENNPEFDKKLLLEKTQKLLDRFIFVFFCEDTAGLLPHNTVENIYKLAKNSFSFSPCRVWEQFRGLFAAIDKGNNNVSPPINAYNGGLFAYDEILDKLVIHDEMFEYIRTLAHYDFESDLNVNILGHIFEQSISDLEQIKNELDGIIEDKKNSKRKKDGIFYTPEYITHYIVEKTVGKYLEENPDKLETIKILDPACGSGAFLNQAHEFLRKQHKIQVEEKINAEESSKKGGQEFLQVNLLKHSNIAENDRSILLNNIFGVDLNKESVEITKLALWLKTAHPNYKLQNLDENIKCGNSLIDDETIAGDKTFRWEEKFKTIMDNGGFDVIIGNPPYGADIKNSYYISSEYKEIFLGEVESYILFYYRAIKLLKNGGILGFITPDSWFTNKTAILFRKWLLENHTVIDIFDVYKPFEDAKDTRCHCVIIKKGKFNTRLNIKQVLPSDNNNIYRMFSLNINDLDLSNEWNLYINEHERRIFKKILSCSSLLESQYKIKYGLRTGDNKSYISNEQGICKIIAGCDIACRYMIEYTPKYLIQKENLPVSYFDENFKKSKIIIQYVRTNSLNINARWLECAYIEPDIIPLNSLSYIYTTDNNEISLKYLLAIMNSFLMNRYYRLNYTDVNIKPLYLSKLPIPNATSEQQQLLAQKANKMIELNKTLFEETKKALELIELEYKPKKITQKLESFYNLGLNPFIEELQKQKVELSLSQKEDLITWYKTKSDFLKNIKSEIDRTDCAIDREVYNLYGLTEEDIKIIEETKYM